MKTYILDEVELTRLVGLWSNECMKRGLILHIHELSFPAARVREGYKAMSQECPEWPQSMGDRDVDIGDSEKTPYGLYRAKHPSHVCKDPRPFEGKEAKLKGFALLDPASTRERKLMNELWHWAIHESKKKHLVLQQYEGPSESAA